MTLREFTKDCEKNCKMEVSTMEWRPTMQLRIKQQDYDRFFKKAERQLQQKWEAVHAGQIVDTKWEAVPLVDEHSDF